MDKALAAETIETIINEIGSGCNKFYKQSDRISDDAARKEFRDHLGAVIEAVNFDLLMPIVREFPELDPDK
jgi:hypothetical protein